MACNIKKKLDVNDDSFAHLTLLLVLCYLADCRSRSLAIYNYHYYYYYFYYCKTHKEGGKGKSFFSEPCDVWGSSHCSENIFAICLTAELILII